MTQTEYNLLLDVLALETCSREEDQLIEFLLAFFEKHQIRAWRDEIGNVYAEKGEVGTYQKYPLVVAHTDTVHRIHGKKIIPKKLLLPNYAGELKPALKGFDATDNPVGLGADCKVGIGICLILFLRQPVLKGFFPVQEEIGARGAEKVNVAFLTNVGYAIEFDSPANTSSITLGNKLMFNPEDENGLGKIWTGLLLEFSENRETEFTLEQHSYTDIVKLRPHFSCINVPVGYYLYHTTDEYLVEEEAFMALDLGEELIKRAGYRYYNDEPHPRVNRLIIQFNLNIMEITGEL
jgi:putative aminopeptidase FrvX